MINIKIPLVKPVINEEIKNRLIDAFENEPFLRGESVEVFENHFAKYIGVKYAIAVNSGTSALFLSLLSLGIKEGDKVITTPATYISTANTVINCGADPVFVDIDINTYNMDPNKVGKATEKYGDKIKAIMPVHLYGYPCDMDTLIEISNKYSIKIIEDASQAHGAKYNGKKVGSIGKVGAFSFYPLKIITVGGDGGMITTNDEEIAEKCIELRDGGRAKDNPHLHNSIGYSARLNTINAAIGEVQLRYLDKWNKNRNEIANLYINELSNIGDIKLPLKSDSKHNRVWYLFSIRTKYRDQLKAFLEKHDIYCETYYKIPVHLQPPYKELGFKKGMYPNTEKWADEILNIPLYSEMTEKEVNYVISYIKKFYSMIVKLKKI
jgi:perosamine synthetase